MLLVPLVLTQAGAAGNPNPFLFVTQVPVAPEVNDNLVSNVFLGVGAGFGNHLGGTLYAPRGGDLWLAIPNGSLTNLTLTNLTRSLGFGLPGAQHTNGIAVREPCVHWDGHRALFSMVAGAPRSSADTNAFFWQIYELSGLPNGPYSISNLAGQPTNYNNVAPCYSPDGRIIFASDRPRDGSPHLYPQLDEYNDYPTVTGLWSLDPASGEFHLLNHTPSGVFTPSVDSYGRLVFIRWDHLVQDRNATDDRIASMTNGFLNGTFNYADESSNSAYDLNDRQESFPEPRTFDGTNLAALKVNGNAFNSFFPWTMFLDGSGEEVLNHMGRHDFLQSFKRSFTNDNNLIDFNISTRSNSQNFVNNFFWLREDPRTNGVYFAVDSPDFGMHGAGQIVTVTAPLGTNADNCFITYLTPKTNNFLNGYGAYRNPLPMSDGSLVAAFATNTTVVDSNAGTTSAPQSRYKFRLYSLKKNGSLWFADQPLTAGLSNSASGSVVQYIGGQLVTNSGALWELYPVEIRSNSPPTALANPINSTEQQVFDEEGVDVALFQKYLRVNNLALVVSHNVTRRDRADRQQPFNLRIAGTTNVTWGPTNGGGNPALYDIAHLQFLQADQLRGYTAGAPTPRPGRRVLATPLHEPAADNVADTNGLTGSLKLGDDGSFAALLPARRAMTHHLLGTNNESIVKERYWITYQPGEIRTCKNCHGINTKDQAGNDSPNNKPQALRDLLRYWKAQNTPVVTIQTNAGTNYLAITFKRRLGVSNVTHTVDLSDNLSGWQPGSFYSASNSAPNTPVTTEVSRSGTNTETITVRENAPLGSVPQRYLRVRVSSP